jgi:hypothetical protein
METSTWLGVHTEVTDKVFGGTPIPDSHVVYYASLMHEFFHAFDFQQNPWVSTSNPTVFNKTPEPDSYCGATEYACGNPYENFADNATLYALEWMKDFDALLYFPNGPAHRVGDWKDLDASGHSKRLSFFNRYFFPGSAANWLR